MPRTVADDLPRAVRLRAQSLGAVGVRWLTDLPDLVASLARDWQLSVGGTLKGGSEGLVVKVARDDGTEAILKIGLPSADLTTEARVYCIAGGRGYAELFAHDEPRNALLIECLGKPIADLGLPGKDQMQILCATLGEAWLPVGADAPLMTGAEKARWLAAFIAETWSPHTPCRAAARDRALEYAARREAAFDPQRSVLVHGDSHEHNALTVPGTPPGQVRCKFVDPDGLRAEPAYDLGILMRDWNDELLAGDPARLGERRCRALAELTSTQEQAIWEWGFVERVSTGLHMMELGMREEATAALAVADRWV